MMKRRLVFAAVFAFALTGSVTPSPAVEKLKVGVAASIQNEVEGVLENTTEKLAEGSEVFFKQVVRTGEASKAHLRLLDDTNLDIWPKTEIRLDDFVYKPGQKKGSVVLRVPLGYVRFVTGSLHAKSYTINTPLGFIGVRGTVFDLVVRADRLTVRLVDGQLRITSLGRRIFWLRTPNSAITIHLDGRVDGPRNWSSDVLEFAALPAPAKRVTSVPRTTVRQAGFKSDAAQPTGAATGSSSGAPSKASADRTRSYRAAGVPARKNNLDRFDLGPTFASPGATTSSPSGSKATQRAGGSSTSTTKTWAPSGAATGGTTTWAPAGAKQ